MNIAENKSQQRDWNSINIPETVRSYTLKFRMKFFFDECKLVYQKSLKKEVA